MQARRPHADAAPAATCGPRRAQGLAVICILLAAAGIDGQAIAADVYRCTVDGRVVYTDRPCAGGERLDVAPSARPPVARDAGAAPSRAEPSATTADGLPQFDAWTTGEHPDAVRAMADLDRRCTTGDARACQTHRLNRDHYAGNRERNRRCAAGDARACDEIRCLAQGDRAACMRVD